jgi:hypothetical protein
MQPKTIAIKGDRELLNRTRIDLTAAGYVDDLEWNNLQQTALSVKYLVIDQYNNIALFGNLYKADKTIHIDRKNYNEVLNELKQKQNDRKN